MIHELSSSSEGVSQRSDIVQPIKITTVGVDNEIDMTSEKTRVKSALPNSSWKDRIRSGIKKQKSQTNQMRTTSSPDNNRKSRMSSG